MGKYLVKGVFSFYSYHNGRDCVAAMRDSTFSVRFLIEDALFLWEEERNMPDYKKLYYELFNKVTDVIEELKQIQCQMEEMYITDTADESESESK